MRWWLFLGLGIGVSTVPSLAQTGRLSDSPRELGELAFATLVNDDERAYMNLVFTQADCDSMVFHADAKDSLKAIVLDQMYGLTAMVRSKASKDFALLRTQGTAAGIDWATAQLVEVQFEIKSRNGIQSCDVYAVGKSGSVDFAVKLHNCHEGSEWHLMGRPELLLK
jgi:hypothetical protein